MWTLDLMRKFVLSYHAEIACPSCKGSRHSGVQIFKAGLLITSEWNDETCEDETTMRAVPIYDRATCFCRSLTSEESVWCEDEAGKILFKDFKEFLVKNAPPQSPQETAPQEKQLTPEWKY